MQRPNSSYTVAFTCQNDLKWLLLPVKTAVGTCEHRSSPASSGRSKAAWLQLRHDCSEAIWSR